MVSISGVKNMDEFFDTTIWNKPKNPIRLWIFQRQGPNILFEVELGQRDGSHK